MPAQHSWIQTSATPAHRSMGRADVLMRLLHAVVYTRPGTASIGLRRMAAHFLRCTPHIETFRDWFGNPAHPALQEVLARRPSLVTCVVHPYLNADWSAARKLDVIGGHYRMLNGRLGFLRFSPATFIDLGEADDGIRIRLDKPGECEHEGELNISLFSAEMRLYSLVFTLAQVGTQRVAYAGGLQGLHHPDALEIYRTLTHRLHGLRPRDLLVAAFRMLCVSLGVVRILAISDDKRVSSKAYFSSSSQVFSSYDSAWADAGGVAVDEGFFEIRPSLVHRSDDDTPSRKRAQYRRRYVMLDELSQHIDRTVQLAGGPGAATLAADIDDA
jgi:uncharacterized protein